MNVIAVIQCTPDDLFNSRDPDDYCVSSLKQSKLFSKIILAIPKLGNYQVFNKLAEEWNVDVYYGSNYNVAERLYNATKYHSPDIVVRVLLKAFFIDIELVKKMINHLQDGFDYVNCDKDYNYALAADVISFSALGKVVDKLRLLPNDLQSNIFRFSPWPFIEELNDFKIYTIHSTLMWEHFRITKIKNKLQKLFNNQENQQAVTVDNPISRYRFVSQYIAKNDTVLDIACGQGGGTALLSEYCQFIYGVDYNENYIANAINTFNKNNLVYLHGTEEIIKNLDVEFDKIVSLHTLEHVKNDKDFLRILFLKLKPSGKLILEIPRLIKYPLGEPLYPFHVKEYDRKELELIFEEIGFKINISYGGNRNHYVDIENAREVLFYVLTR